MCARVHVCRHVHACVCMRTCICVCLCVCECMCVHACVSVWGCMCTRVHVCACVYMHACMCVCVCIHTCVRVHVCSGGVQNGGILLGKRVSIVVTMSQQCSIILWAKKVTAMLNYRSHISLLPGRLGYSIGLLTIIFY